VTNVEAELLKNAAGDPAQVAELQARVKELEMEQILMQRELDNMSDVAQRTDNQLRYSPVLLCHSNDEHILLAAFSSVHCMKTRHLSPPKHCCCQKELFESCWQHTEPW